MSRQYVQVNDSVILSSPGYIDTKYIVRSIRDVSPNIYEIYISPEDSNRISLLIFDPTSREYRIAGTDDKFQVRIDPQPQPQPQPQITNVVALTGVDDVDLQILSRLDDYDLTKACQLNVQIARLCRDPKLWQQRLKQRFPQMLSRRPIFPEINDKDFYILTAQRVKEDKNPSLNTDVWRKGNEQLYLTLLNVFEAKNRDDHNSLIYAITLGYPNVLRQLCTGHDPILLGNEVEVDEHETDFAPLFELDNRDVVFNILDVLCAAEVNILYLIDAVITTKSEHFLNWMLSRNLVFSDLELYLGDWFNVGSPESANKLILMHEHKDFLGLDDDDFQQFLLDASTYRPNIELLRYFIGKGVYLDDTTEVYFELQGDEVSSLEDLSKEDRKELYDIIMLWKKYVEFPKDIDRYLPSLLT
jgi:hypothetical protein